MKVQCIYCRAEIELNQDSEASRLSGTDPHQQLRRHLYSHSVSILTSHVAAVGFLADALAFIPVEVNLADNEYLTHLVAMVQHFQSPEWMEQRRDAL